MPTCCYSLLGQHTQTIEYAIYQHAGSLALIVVDSGSKAHTSKVCDYLQPGPGSTDRAISPIDTGFYVFVTGYYVLENAGRSRNDPCLVVAVDLLPEGYNSTWPSPPAHTTPPRLYETLIDIRVNFFILKLPTFGTKPDHQCWK